jgi:hypothetical protein
MHEYIDFLTGKKRLKSDPYGTDWLDKAARDGQKEIEDNFDKYFLEVVDDIVNKDTYIMTIQKRPFLEGKSETALKYYDISCKMMDHRIETRMNDDWHNEENIFLDQLDEIWRNATTEELQEIEDMPSQWWFQHLDKNGQVTQQSELDVYPYAQYFVKQKPHLLGDDVSIMKGKPFFGGEWLPRRPVMFFMILEKTQGFDNLFMKTMSNTHYDDLQNGYDFVEYSGICPIFRSKNNP